MINVYDAERFSKDILCNAMNQAFSDYAVPMQLSLSGFSFMMRQRGLHRGASFVATIDDEVAAIWLMSVRGRNAYLICSGTKPQFRQRGLARKLAERSLSWLRRNSVESLQTEVMVQNANAHRLYASLGMDVSRPLECYTLARRKAPMTQSVVKASWQDIAQEVTGFSDVEPSWQNTSLSIEAVANDVHCWATTDSRGLSGYLVLLPETLTVAQIGVRKDCRRQKIASSLLDACSDLGPLRFINIDGRSADFKAFLKAVGAQYSVSQFELAMKL